MLYPTKRKVTTKSIIGAFRSAVNSFSCCPLDDYHSAECDMCPYAIVTPEIKEFRNLSCQCFRECTFFINHISNQLYSNYEDVYHTDIYRSL